MLNAQSQELMALERRKKLAEQLLGQGMQTSPVGHPLEAVARVFQAYLGNQQMKEADQGLKDYDTGQQQKLAQALETYQNKMSGMTPPDPREFDQMGEGTPFPQATQGQPDRRGALAALLNSGNPMLAQAGVQGMLQQPKADDPFTLKPGETRFGAGGKPIAALPAEPKEDSKPKLGALRSIVKGGNEEQQEWDGSKWVQVGGGPRWQAPQGDGSPKAPAGYRWGADGKTLEAIPGGPAMPKPSEGYLKQQTGVQNVRDAIGEYREHLKTLNAASFLNPETRAKSGTIYNNMLLQAKEAYNLGVLNGPDYMILQKVIRDPMSITAQFSRGSLDDQAKKLDELMDKIGRKAAEVHNQPAPGGGKFRVIGRE